ncbi:MAG: hypothetical protein PHQ42_05060 [Patescibacteria group bacterium]|nr:hypothetical protein [Patescibacteria group bacterium]
MAEVKFKPDVIEIMAKGKFEERVKCPVCGEEKDPRAWICEACFKKHGYSLVAKVQAAVRLASKVSPEVGQNLLRVARQILSAPDRPKGVENKDLVKALRSNLPDVSEGAIFAAFAAVRKEMEAEAKEAARKAEKDGRWRAALAAVDENFPRGEEIKPAFFVSNPVRHNGGIISTNMMKAACAQVRKERKWARENQMADAFVKSHLRSVDFPGINQPKIVAASA